MVKGETTQSRTSESLEGKGTEYQGNTTARRRFSSPFISAIASLIKQVGSRGRSKKHHCTANFYRTRFSSKFRRTYETVSATHRSLARRDGARHNNGRHEGLRNADPKVDQTSRKEEPFLSRGWSEPEEVQSLAKSSTGKAKKKPDVHKGLLLIGWPIYCPV